MTTKMRGQNSNGSHYIPNTLVSLLREIKGRSDYTYGDIRKVYLEAVNKYKDRNKYYAKRAGIKRLQGFYFSLLEKERNNNV